MNDKQEPGTIISTTMHGKYLLDTTHGQVFVPYSDPTVYYTSEAVYLAHTNGHDTVDHTIGDTENQVQR